jgi:hypothetical protein
VARSVKFHPIDLSILLIDIDDFQHITPHPGGGDGDLALTIGAQRLLPFGGPYAVTLILDSGGPRNISTKVGPSAAVGISSRASLPAVSERPTLA